MTEIAKFNKAIEVLTTALQNATTVLNLAAANGAWGTESSDEMDSIEEVKSVIGECEDAIELAATLQAPMPRRASAEIPEAEQTRRGQLIADTFLLRKDLPDYPDRYKTTGGNKTALGVFKTMERLIADGK